MEDKRKIVYDKLVSATGYKDSFDEFNKLFDASDDNKRKVYDALGKTGYKDSFEDFVGLMKTQMPTEKKSVETEQPQEVKTEQPQAVENVQPFVQNPKVTDYILGNKPDMFKSRSGNYATAPFSPGTEPLNELDERYRIASEMSPYMAKEQNKGALRSLEDDVAALRSDLTNKINSQKEESSGLPVFRSDAGAALMRQTNEPKFKSKEALQLQNVEYAEKLLNQSKRLLEEGENPSTSFMQGFGSGISDSLSDLDKWAMGWADLDNALRVKGIINKIENDKPLDASEQAVMDAMVTNAATEMLYRDSLGRGYKAGDVVGESLPFMLDMIIDMGTVKAATKPLSKAMMKYATDKLKSMGLKAGSLGMAAGRGVAHLGSGLKNVGIHTATFGAPRVAADYQERGLGQTGIGITPSGQAYYTGQQGQESGAGTFAKSVISTAAETGSELLGEKFAPILGFLGRATGLDKLGKLIPKSIGNRANEIVNSQAFKEVKKFADTAHISDPISETMEEEVNNLVSLAIGDMSYEQLKDADLHIDTFLGVAPVSILFGAAGVGNYTRAKYKLTRDMRNFERRMDEEYGEDWTEVRNALQNSTIEEAREFVKDILAKNNLSRTEKADMVRYVFANMQEQTLSSMDLTVSPEDIEANKREIVNDYMLAAKRADFLNDADKARVMTMSVEEIEGLNVPEKEKQRIIDYKAAREAYDAYIDVTNQRVERARQQAIGQVEELTNITTGTVMRVQSGYSESPIYIVRGNVKFNDKGEMDPSQSDNVMYYLAEDGSVKMGSTKMIQSLLDETDAAVMAENAANDAQIEIETQENAETSPISVGDEFQVGETIYGVQSVAPDGNYLVNVTQNGQAQIVPMTEEQLRDLSITKQAEIADANEMSAETSENAETPQAQESTVSNSGTDKKIEYPRDKDGNIDFNSFTPEQAYQYTAEVSGEDVAREDLMSDINSLQEEVNKLNEQAKKAQGGKRIQMRQQIAEKMKQLNSMQEFYQSLNPVEMTQEEVQTEELPQAVVETEPQETQAEPDTYDVIADLNKDLTPDEVDAFVSNNIKEQEKQLASIEKKAPKIGTDKAKYLADKKAWEEQKAEINKQIDYWKVIQEEIKDMRSQIGDAEAAEILSQTEPQTAEEFAALVLGKGGLKLNRDSYMKETGYGQEEAKKMFGLFSKDGVSIERAGEILETMAREEGLNFFAEGEVNAGRTAILNVLSEARTRGELINYIKINREKQAEKERQAAYNQYEQDILNNYDMTVEEYEQYVEVAEREIGKRNLSDEEYAEFMNDFIDELNSKENGRETTNTSGSETSGEVLQGEQSDNNGGSTEIEGQPTEVDGGSDNTNEPASEETTVEEVPTNEQTTETAQEPIETQQAIQAAESEVNTEPTDNKIRKGESVFEYAQRVAEQQSKKRNKPNKKKINLRRFVDKSKEEYRKVLSGVFYKDGTASSSNGQVAVRVKADYPSEYEGKSIDKDGTEIKGKYPSFDLVVPKKSVATFSIDIESLKQQRDSLLNSLRQAWETEEGKKGTFNKFIEDKGVILRIGNLSRGMRVSVFNDFIDALEMTGVRELSIGGEILYNKNEKELLLAVAQSELPATSRGDIMLTDYQFSEAELEQLTDFNVPITDMNGIPQSEDGRFQVYAVKGTNGNISYSVSSDGKKVRNKDKNYSTIGDRVHSTLDEAIEASNKMREVWAKDNQQIAERENRMREERAEQERKAKEKAESTLGKFLATLPKLQAGKVDKGLSERLSFNGMTMSKADFIQEVINDGYKAEEYIDGTSIKYRLTKDGKGYKINKTEFDFAKFAGAETIEVENKEDLINLERLSKKYADKGVYTISEIDKKIAFTERRLKGTNPNGKEGKEASKMLEELKELKRLKEMQKSGELRFREEDNVEIDDFFADNTPASQQKQVESLDKNKTYGIDKVKELFFKYATNKEQIELAKRVFDIAEKVGFKVSFMHTDLGFNIGGRADGENIQYSHITTMEKNKSKLPDVLLHEVIHGCTVYAMDAYKNGELKNPQLIEAVESINDVYEQVKSDETVKGEYGVKNAKEMVAEMANPAFRAKLKAINVWDKLKQAIKKLFFFDDAKDVTANKVLSDALDKMLDNFDYALFDDYGRAKTVEDAAWDFVEMNDKSLIGVHNISEDKLKKTMKQGGLANPSTAVIDVDTQDFEGYGEISLIMPSSLVDKKTGRNAGTYSGDAWTPVYPDVKVKIDDKGLQKGYDRVDEAIKDEKVAEMLKSEMRSLSDNEGRMEFLFLAERGENPEVVYKKAEGLSLSDINEKYGISEGGTEQYAKFKELPEDKKLELGMLIAHRGNKEKVDKIKQIMASDEKYEKAFKPNYMDIGFAQFDSFMYDLFKKERDKGQIDRYDTLRNAREQVKKEGLTEEYEKWKSELLEYMDAKEMIFNGYDRNGRAKYIENTLENVSKIMKKQGKTNTYGDKNLSATRAAFLKKFNSLAAIRKEKGRLSSEEVYTEEYNRLNDEYSSIVSELAEMQTLSDNPLFNTDYAAGRLQEAIDKGNPIQYLEEEYGYELSDGFKEDLQSFLDNVSAMPSKYFETKFERPVYISEFASAVVPKTLSDDVKQYLSEQGLTLHEYDENVEGDRKRAMLEASQDEGIRFRYITEEYKDVEVPEEYRKYMDAPVKREPAYDAESVFNFVYRMSGKYSKPMMEARKGILIPGTGQINMEAAQNLKEVANRELGNKKQELLDAMANATMPARRYLMSIVNDIDDALKFFDELAEGKDVWRWKDPYYRFIGEQALTEQERNAQMAEFANETADKVGVPIQVLNSLDEVPEGKAKEAIQKGRRIKGWFDVKTGKVYVYMPNATSAEDVQRTILHEGVAHYGLRKLVGDEYMDDFLDEVFANVSKSVRERIAALLPKYRYDARVATEEYMASMAEGDTEISTWNRIKQAFKELLRKVGIKVKISDNELKYILWRSAQNLRMSNPLDMAKDVAMQYELGVGNYLREVPYTNEEQTIIDEAKKNGTFMKAPNGEPTKLTEKQWVQVRTKAFKDWFGDWENDADNASKVVDENGEPMVVYHGTPYDFNAFDTNMIGSNTGGTGWYGAGFYFSDRGTDFYGKNVKGVFLNIRNMFDFKDNWEDFFKENAKQFPLYLSEEMEGVVEDYDAFLDVLNDAKKYNWSNSKIADFFGTWDWTSIPNNPLPRDVKDSLTPLFINKGYDGAKGEGTNTFGNEYIAFYPTQIKSATDNTGDFDPNNPDIRFRDDTSINEYNETFNNAGYWGREAWQDSMLSLKNLQDVVEKQSGEPIKDFENAYMAENQLGRLNRAQSIKFWDEYMKPLADEIAKLVKSGVKYEEVLDYMMLSHGIERNVEMSNRAKIEDEYKKNPDKQQAKADREAAYNQFYSDINALRQKYKGYEYLKALSDYFGKVGDYSATEAVLSRDGKKHTKFQKEALERVREFEENYDVENLRKKTSAATSETLKKTYESGLMDKETYNKVKNMFVFYVPLRGWEQTTAEEVWDYLGDVNPVNSTLKKMKGRKSIPDDVFATIGNMGESAIVQGNRNLMKQKFYNMAVNHPTDLVTVKGAWYVKDANGDMVISLPEIKDTDTPEQIAEKVRQHEEDMKQNPDAVKSKKGLNINYPATNQSKAQHSVIVRIGGKDYVLYVNGNPRAAQAVNGLTNPDAETNKLLKATYWLNRQMSALYTSRNPEFVQSNFMRDYIEASTVIATKEDAEYNAKYRKNVRQSIVDTAKGMKGKLKGDAKKYFDEFIQNGGQMGFMTINDVNTYKKKLKRQIDDITGRRGSARKALRFITDAIETLNTYAETVSRYAVYRTSREMGRTIEQSIKDAADVTVNFSKKGSGFKAMGGKMNKNGQISTFAPKFFGMTAGTAKMLYLFINPAVQSLANWGYIAKKNKGKIAGLVGGFAAMGYFVPILNQFLWDLFGDDDEECPYNDLPEWTRRNNLCVGFDKYLTIPLPHTLRAFYGMGEMAYQLSTGRKEMSPGEIAYEIAGQVSALLPLDPLGNEGDIVKTLTPSSVKPVAEAMIWNEDFMGKPIAKETPFNEKDPEWKRVYKGTAGWLVDATKFLNDLTAGDEAGRDFRKGWWDWNPAKIEHLGEAYLGGTWTFLNNAGKTIYYGGKSLIQGEKDDDLVLRNVPFVRRLVVTPDERSAFSSVNEAYFDLVDEMEQFKYELDGVKKSIKSDPEKYEWQYEDLMNSEDYERYRIYEGYKEMLDNLYQMTKFADDETRKELEEEIQNGRLQLIEELKK